MADVATQELLGEQIDVDNVVSALGSLVSENQQNDTLPIEETGQDTTALNEEVIETDQNIIVEDDNVAVSLDTAPDEQLDIKPVELQETAPVEDALVETAPVETAPVAVAPVKQELEPESKIIVFEGHKFKVSKGFTNEEITQLIQEFEKTPRYAAKRAQTDPAFARTIDSESGVPAIVNAAVGPSGDLSKEDRLATLKNYYPDATYYGEDNFIFTDVDTKKLTLYNPPGFEMGDVVEYGKVITEVAAGGLGLTFGTLSSLATGPAAPVTAYTMGMLGLGVGTEIGARLFETSMGLFSGRVRSPKTVVEEFTETGARISLAVAGQKAGELIAVGGKRALTGGRQAAADLIAKFEYLGIEPVGAAIGREGMLSRMAAGFEQMAAAGPIMQKQAEKVIVQLDDALQRVASKMGTIRTPNEAGVALKQSVIAAEKRAKDTFSEEYTKIFDEIGEGSLIEQLSSVDKALQPYLKQIAELPAEAQPAGNVLTLVKKWSSLSKFAEAGNMPFGELVKLRTQLRLIKSKSSQSGTEGDYDGLVRNIYDAITDDLANAANSVRPDLGGKLAKLNQKRFDFADTAQKTIDKIKSFDADNAAFEFIMTSAKGSGASGIKTLQRLRENFTPEEWGDVAASTLYNLGRENVGAQVGQVAEFSVATFMKRIAEIKKAGPESMEALFGGTQSAEVAGDLLKLVDVVGALKEVKRVANVSNTAGALNQMVFWGSLVKAGESMLRGNMGEAATIVGGTIIAPTVAAKLMTTPGFVKWLSTPANEIEKNISGHIGRLVALADAEPEIREEIRQYYKAIRSYTGYNEPAQQGTEQ
jgi:hypothetical protein